MISVVRLTEDKKDKNIPTVTRVYVYNPVLRVVLSQLLT